MAATARSRGTKGHARLRRHRLLLGAVLLAGGLLTAVLGVFLWRWVVSSEGASREVAVAQPPSIEQAGIDLKFEPFRCPSGDGFLDAKNYGPLKAWTLDLSKMAQGA